MIIIAEIGINHNGDLEIAKKLIKHAKECGCDIVKFQKRNPNICIPENQKNAMKYDTPWGDISYLEYRNKIEFGEGEYNEIDRYCKFVKIDWAVSSWDLDSQHFLQKYNLKYNKVCSPMLTNIDLLEEIAKEKKYTFVSTGMSTFEEIDRAVEIFKRRNCPFELMHCNSSYPMNPVEANLKCIHTLMERYNCNVGYSGHEAGLQVTLAAVALGATSIERHITLDRTMYGSDQAASLGPHGLRSLVRDCRIIEVALGDGVKRVFDSELKKRKQLRGY